MARKESKKVNCPECNELIGSQGLGLHRLHKHGVRRKKEEPETKEENIIEDIMPKEETKEEPQTQPVIEQPKEESKPDPKTTSAGDEKKPEKKGSSFLDWIFGEDNKSSVPKSDPKKESDDDDDWW